MKIRPAFFVLLSALALGATFFAGYAVRDSRHEKSLDRKAAAVVEALPNNHDQATTVANPGRTFPPGEAEAWVRQIDERQDLYGARLRMHVAQQCALLDADAAEELLKKMDLYVKLSEACFPLEWHPSNPLLDEMALDALTRLSELDPERAFALLQRSLYLQDSKERLAAVLAPIAAVDIGRVVEFLKSSPSDWKLEAIYLLRQSTAVREGGAEASLQLLPLCLKNAEVAGSLLGAIGYNDQALARKTLAELVLKNDPETSWALWETAKWFFGADREAMVKWAEDQAGPDAVPIQKFVLSTLAEGWGIGEPVSDISYAGELFLKIGESLPQDEQMNDARVIGADFVITGPDQAVKWLAELKDGPLKEKVMEGMCEGSLRVFREGRGQKTKENAQPGFWLKMMAPSGERDSLLLDYAEQLQDARSPEAAEWLKMISDPKTKKRGSKILKMKQELARLESGEE